MHFDVSGAEIARDDGTICDQVWRRNDEENVHFTLGGGKKVNVEINKLSVKNV